MPPTRSPSPSAIYILPEPCSARRLAADKIPPQYEAVDPGSLPSYRLPADRSATFRESHSYAEPGDGYLRFRLAARNSVDSLYHPSAIRWKGPLRWSSSSG